MARDPGGAPGDLTPLGAVTSDYCVDRDDSLNKPEDTHAS